MLEFQSFKHVTAMQDYPTL